MALGWCASPAVRFGRSLSRVMLFIVAALFWAAEVEAKGRRARKRKGQQLDRSFWKTIKWTYFAVFVPVFLFFVYSVWKDPDSGKIARNTWKQVQKRSMGFLKNKKKKKKKSKKTHEE